jgi:hypothetical protein
VAFRINHFHRLPAAKKSCASLRTGMFAKTPCHIGRDTRVQTAVTGLDDVDKPTWACVFRIGFIQCAMFGLKISEQFNLVNPQRHLHMQQSTIAFKTDLAEDFPQRAVRFFHGLQGDQSLDDTAHIGGVFR